jgi:hypothetical protein
VVPLDVPAEEDGSSEDRAGPSNTDRMHMALPAVAVSLGLYRAIASALPLQLVSTPIFDIGVIGHPTLIELTLNFV